MTSIAPTGTLSILADTTAGIEPMFAVSYMRRTLGTSTHEVNRHFHFMAEERGLWSPALARKVARTGRLRGRTDIPADLQRLFVTALEIPALHHVRIQAAFQRHVDAAVSKTINLPEDATLEDVREVYLAAWRAGLKGVTVYRYGSRPEQVLHLAEDEGVVRAAPDYAGGCVAPRACDY